MASDTELFGELFVVDFLACVADKVVGKETQGIDVAYVETIFYVFGDDGFYQSLHVGTFVMYVHQFGESAVGEIVV